MKHSSAFTLVELIVVITILAILSTIAFLSFSGYSASARDSVRMEDMKNLQQGLTLNMAKAGSISYPSNAKQVFLSGSLFLYQGYVDQNLKNIANLEGKASDPLDGSEYTITTNTSGTEFQLLGFLETNDYNVVTASGLINPPGRYAYVIGTLTGGTILSSQTGQPIQKQIAGAQFDLGDGTGYTMIYSPDTIFTGSGTQLVTDISNALLPADITTGLVGYWKFDEGAGTTTADSSSFGNNGILSTSTIWYNDPIRGSVAKFTGSEKIEAPDNASLDISDKLTISTWINPETMTGIYAGNILGKGSIVQNSPRANNYNYVMYYFGKNSTWSDNDITFFTSTPASIINNYNGWLEFSPYYTMSIGSWSQVTIVYDSSKKEGDLYINGVPVGTTTDPNLGNLTNNNDPLQIGWNGAEGGFHGLIDNVRIYHRALAPRDVQALYMAEKK